MRLYFSWRVCLIGALLIGLFLRLAWWQWDRHLEKQVLIAELKQRVTAEPQELSQLIASKEALPFRLALVSGKFDFSHEVVLRNRVLNGVPGVLVLTPLKLNNADSYILLNRGFLPLIAAQREDRVKFQTPETFNGTILLKASVQPALLASADPASGKDLPWVDQWLRPNLEAISKQLPYEILPFYGEVVPADLISKLAEKIVSNEGGREEILSLEMRQIKSDDNALDPQQHYPIAQVDTVMPPDIHLGYTIQWCIISFITFLICLLMQRKPRRQISVNG